MTPQSFDPVQYKVAQRRDWDAVAQGWKQWWKTIEQGAQPVSDLHQCRCEVRHVALRHLLYRDKDEELAARVTRIKTKFWVSQEEQTDLFTAAKLLVKELEDSHLLPDASVKTKCGTHAAAAQK